ncbi:hypothetical protein JVU11DRAFT_9185 [Chiua virens]|nr:hypothetical protein JVU11DRAFT_9185 [Chiua virens]
MENEDDVDFNEELDVNMSPPPPPPAIHSVRSGRHIRLPARYIDFLPGQFAGLRQVPYVPSLSAPPGPEPESPSTSQESHSDSSISPTQFTTRSDSMGLYRIYPVPPTFILNTDSLLDVVDAPTLEQNQSHHTADSTTPTTLNELYSVFSGPTAALLMLWDYSGSTTKSISELNRLAISYCGDPLFNPADVASFSHERERKHISRYLQEEFNPFRATHGWMKTTLDLPLPTEQARYRSKDAIPTIEVEVIHRSITEIITSVFKDTIASTFHMTPFEQYWNTSEDRAVKVYSEVYSSPRILEMYKEVNALPRDIDDTYERVVLPLMVWSDATQLANFGDASLWPIYLLWQSVKIHT